MKKNISSSSVLNLPYIFFIHQRMDGFGYLFSFVFCLFTFALFSQDSTVYNLSYCTFLGGSDFEQARDMAVDKEGNFYITGGTSSPDFPTTIGAYNTEYNDAGSETVGNWGPMMVFVCKFSKEGNLIWSTFLGGPNYDRAYAIEVDDDGYVYLGGRAGDDFPTTPGAFQEEFAKKWPTNNLYGHQNGFVAKLSPDGSELIWATYYGADSFGFFRDIDVDDQGYVYGILNAVKNLPGGIPDDAFDTTLNGDYDMVPVKFTPDGSDVVWATVLGGSGEDRGGPAIRVGPDKSVYVSGGTHSMDWPVTPNVAQTQAGGNSDIFVTRIAPDGKSLIYSTYFGGNDDEFSETHILTLDYLGQAHVACASRSTNVTTTPGAIKPMKPASDDLDALLFKLSLDGQLLACTYFGGAEFDGAEGLYVDSLGNFYVGGGTSSEDFSITPGAIQSQHAGLTDGFVIKINPSFDTLLYSTYFGGSEDDAVRAFNVLSDGTIGLSGQTFSTDLPIAGNTFQNNHASPGNRADSYFAILDPVDLPSFVETVYEDSSIAVFPNPSSSKITVLATERIQLIRLIDQKGKILLEHLPNNNETDLILDRISAGRYWLLIRMENGEVKAKPLIIQR